MVHVHCIIKLQSSPLVTSMFIRSVSDFNASRPAAQFSSRSSNGLFVYRFIGIASGPFAASFASLNVASSRPKMSADGFAPSSRKARSTWFWPPTGLRHSDWLRAANDLPAAPNYLQQSYPHPKDKDCTLDEARHVYYAHGFQYRYSVSDAVGCFFPEIRQRFVAQIDRVIRAKFAKFTIFSLLVVHVSCLN